MHEAAHENLHLVTFFMWFLMGTFLGACLLLIHFFLIIFRSMLRGRVQFCSRLRAQISAFYQTVVLGIPKANTKCNFYVKVIWSHVQKELVFDL